METSLLAIKSLNLKYRLKGQSALFNCFSAADQSFNQHGAVMIQCQDRTEGQSGCQKSNRSPSSTQVSNNVQSRE